MIRLAKKEDLDIIMPEIQKVKEEMHESGNPQWGNTSEEYPSKKDFLEDIENNSLYVFEEDAQIKGLVCIKEDTEYEYDPYIQNSHERAFVLHRMAVFLDYRGEHISKEFFKYADDLAKENHISLLKADTEVQNQKMNAILKRLQYEFKGEFTPNYPGKYNYYEKRIEQMKYEIIVVGGGHAGIEASHIAAFKGHKTLLITMNKKNIGDMPCNPSIGGTAKGIIVREIDALGGIMGRIADISHFQIKMLNNSKGPAVRSLRAQADKTTYPKNMQNELENTPNLSILESTVEDLIIDGETVKGVILANGEKIYADAVILTTGTYLKANILIGAENTPSGPHGEARSNHLSDNLKKYGFTIQRLKTGTPQRIKASSIDFSKMTPEYGDDTYWTFSFDNPPVYKINEQQKCYLIYTNENTHKIILDNLDKSAMYGGYVTGVGPRYCPSIEDKLVRFKDKERHQLFLEPESLYYDEWYLQGFSTSMPRDIQERMVHSLSGLENAVISKYAYAIEYDAIDPLQIMPSLETKVIKNLFTAGQINGTSGYEEAAGQGLIAGINASLKLEKKEPLILKRNDAYIGVLIDDLVTKGTAEPYRMLTSRAEFRLILRHDNADLRLREYAHKVGSITDKQYQNYLDRVTKLKEREAYLQETKCKITQEVKEIFIENQKEVPNATESLYNLLKRPEITMNFLEKIVEIPLDNQTKEELEIQIKYEGYIKKTYKEVEKMKKLEEKIIPQDIDYKKVKNLASEARQKLEKIRPISVGQAARISGVNPSDIAILSIYLKKEYGKDE